MNLLKDHSHRTQFRGRAGAAIEYYLLFFFIFWRSFLFSWRKGRYVGGEGGGHGSMWAVGAVGVVGAVWVAREGRGAVAAVWVKGVDGR